MEKITDPKELEEVDKVGLLIGKIVSTFSIVVACITAFLLLQVRETLPDILQCPNSFLFAFVVIAFVFLSLFITLTIISVFLMNYFYPRYLKKRRGKINSNS